MTYLELLETSQAFLQDKGFNKNIILQIIYGLDDNVKSLTDIADKINEEIDGDLLYQILDGLYDHVVNKKPLSYVTHNSNFLGRKFIIDDNVLPPRPETEEWTKILIDTIREHGELDVLDLCCGSGVIGLSVKKALPYCRVTLADISKTAVSNTRKNAIEMGVFDDVYIVESNLFSALANHRYDVIVCNPPYVDYNETVDKGVNKYEPYNAIYAPNRGLYFYEAILKNVEKYLNNKFLIMMEIGFNLAGDVINLVKKYLGVEPEIYVDKDYNDRVVVINRL